MPWPKIQSFKEVCRKPSSQHPGSVPSLSHEVAEGFLQNIVFYVVCWLLWNKIANSGPKPASIKELAFGHPSVETLWRLAFGLSLVFIRSMDIQAKLCETTLLRPHQRLYMRHSCLVYIRAFHRCQNPSYEVGRHALGVGALSIDIFLEVQHEKYS